MAKAISTPPPPASQNNYLKYILNLWIFVPAIAYLNTVNKYAVNFPYQDDYNAILEFLCKFKQAGFMDKFWLLFSQHGQHRIFHSRLVYVLYDAIMGKINFRNIIFIGNVQLIAIFVLLTYFIKKAIPKYWNVVACAVGICLFDLSNYENADFAMAAMQNYGVIMLFLLSLYFFALSTQYKHLLPALLFEVICIFSSGNGILAVLCIIAFLLLNKQKVKAMAGGAAFVLFAPLYFLHYTKEVAQGEIMTGFHMDRIVPYFFHMMGSHFCYDYQYNNGVIIGIIFLIVLLLSLPLSLKLKIKENTLPLLCILAFSLASVATTSVFRSNIDDIQHLSHSSRYVIYSNIMTGLIFIFLFIKLEQHKVKWAVVGAMVVLLIYGYSENYPFGEAGFSREKIRLENVEYYYGDHTPASMAKAKKIADEACQLNIYCIKDER